MKPLQPLFNSSVGRKIIMALTGLFLCLFLVVHLSGNLLLFKNDGGYLFNQYSDFMEGNWVIRFLEIVLFAGILFHLVDALALTIKNKSARPIPYTVNHPSQNSTWFSRNMGLTGSLILLFLVIHLRTFMFGQRFFHKHSSMFESVSSAFRNPYYSGFYVLAIGFLGFHLFHGFQSTFQSLGLNDKMYAKIFRWIGALFSLIIPLGFIAMPVYFFLKR